jgi:Ca2+-binding RTX toxin-like protein
MRIKGTGKGETIHGTDGADLIDAGAGNDTIIAGPGPDTITGGKGADTFVFGPDSQYDVITDFNPSEGDHVLLDFGTSASAPIYSGALYDGLSFDACGGTCHVTCVDFNADGIMDTQLSINGGNIFLLGCLPSDVHGADILGT